MPFFPCSRQPQARGENLGGGQKHERVQPSACPVSDWCCHWRRRSAAACHSIHGRWGLADVSTATLSSRKRFGRCIVFSSDVAMAQRYTAPVGKASSALSRTVPSSHDVLHWELSSKDDHSLRKSIFLLRPSFQRASEPKKRVGSY